jgi:hypothetical protein
VNKTTIHDSDCALHNAPALPVGPCDCSVKTPDTLPHPTTNEGLPEYDPKAPRNRHERRALGKREFSYEIA